MAPPTITQRRPEVVTRELPSQRAAWITSVTSADHKVVAKLFMGTALSFLAVAVVQFALTRLHLIVPDSTIFRPEIFNRIQSASLVSISVLFAVPFMLGLLSYVVPLQIGARGVALPRLNQLAYALYAAGALVVYVSFLYSVPETALSPLPPLSDDVFSPAGGVDAWVGGVTLATLGFVCWAINMVSTLRNLRAPGMAWRRAPVFAWAARVISYLLLLAGPAMLAALTMLSIDRHFGGVFFDPGEGGDPLLFAHLSWIYFTAIHTIMVIGVVAIVTEIVPSLSRKPLFSHGAATGSILAIGVLGTIGYLQNLYSSPMAEGFAFLGMLACLALLVPIGISFFNWMATMSGGAVQMRAPMALSLAAAVALVFGLGGQFMTAVPAVGLLLEHTVAAQQDTIMVLVGFILACFAGLHYWMPKITGRTVAEGPAKAAAGLILVSSLVFAFMMFFAGLAAQPVDSSRYLSEDGVSTLNLFASIAAFFMVIGVLVELANLAASYTGGRVTGHDPWGGSTLEWFALSPPPPHNFDAIPDVRSHEPLRDIREAIREREAAYVPPAPLPASAPPEIGVPDPGPEAGLSEEAASVDAPTADPEDVAADESTEAADAEPADEQQPEEAHAEGTDAGDDPAEAPATSDDSAADDATSGDDEDSAESGEDSSVS